MGLMLDTTPMRASRDFRRLWCAQAVSFLGSTVTMAALPLEVYRQTHSSVMVGVLGAVQLVPMVACSMAGGALADSIDKRVLLLGVTLASAACSAGLAANAALHHPQLWLLLVLGAGNMALFGLTFPVLRSLLPLLLEPELRPAGFALQATYGTFGMMSGPVIGGVMIGAFGFGPTYLFDVGTYAIAFVLFSRISAAPPAGAARPASLATIREGLRFVRARPVIVSILGIDTLAMVFGMPRALFPALTARLGGGPILYGFMLGSFAAGAFLASVTSGWTGRVRKQGRAVIMCVALWGIAIAVAGVTDNTATVLVMFAFAGGADMISGVYRSAIAADATPDEMRGRVSGVELAVYAGGPVLGDVESGLVGGLIGLPFAIVSGGLACVVGAGLFAWKVPEFANYVPALGARRGAE